MSFQRTPKTADELGLMCGFPPPPDARVTHATQLLGPYNRWSFQNIQKLNPTADVWRGNGPVAHFDEEPGDIGGTEDKDTTLSLSKRIVQAYWFLSISTYKRWR